MPIMLQQQVCPHTGAILLWPQQSAVLAGISKEVQPQSDWFNLEYWQQQQGIRGSAEGRGTTYFVEYDGQAWVWRHYCRGGLIAKCSKEAYVYTGLSRTRAFKELQLLAAMQQRGLPVPTPIAARVQRRGLLYSADILTSRIEAAHDMHQLLQQGPQSLETWQKIGAAIAQLHHAQVYHHDLNIHNILCDAKGKIWIIDFDRCGFRPGKRWQQANLQRLLRSLNKEQQRCLHYNFYDQDWQALMSGYMA